MTPFLLHMDYCVVFIVSNKTFNWMIGLTRCLVSIDLNNILEKESHQVLAEIFNNTSDQLSDPTLNFWPVIADDMCSLREQANTLVEWCQGFLVGLGLSSVETSDEEVLEMIKDISEISQLDDELLDSEENTQDFYEIVNGCSLYSRNTQNRTLSARLSFTSSSKYLAVIKPPIILRNLYRVCL